MAFFGDTLAHIILQGVVAAFLLGWPLVSGALIVGVAAALVIGAISRGSTIKEDAAIGEPSCAGCLALGIALLSARRGYAVDLTHILFGNLLGVWGAFSDLALITILGTLALLAVFALYKEFLVLSFDPLLATTLRPAPGGPAANLMLILLAVVIVVCELRRWGWRWCWPCSIWSYRPRAASPLTRRLPVMMGVGAAIGAASAIVGLYLSYYTNLPSGPAIVLTATALLFVALVFGRRQKSAAELPHVFSPLRCPFKQQSSSRKPAASSCTPPSRSAAHSPRIPTPLRRPVEEVVGGPSADPRRRQRHGRNMRVVRVQALFHAGTRWR